MNGLTFSQAVEGFLLTKRAERKSSNTLDQYRWAFDKFLDHGDPRLASVTTDDVRAFLITMEHLSPK